MEALHIVFLGMQVMGSHSFTQSDGPQQCIESHSLKSIFKGVNPVLDKAEQGPQTHGEWMNSTVLGSCRTKAKGFGLEILSIYYSNPICFSNKRIVKEWKTQEIKRDEEMKK